jgi:hypothetical protein
MGYPLAVKLGTITPDGAGEWTFAEFRNVQWIRRIAVASYMDYQL